MGTAKATSLVYNLSYDNTNVTNVDKPSWHLLHGKLMCHILGLWLKIKILKQLSRSKIKAKC